MPRYQLSILAERLPRGMLRQPNPYAKVVISGGPREGETIGETETLENTQDADFLKTLFFETDSSIFLPLKVTIYNSRNDSVLTEAVFEATEVNASPGHIQEQKDSQNGAKIVVSVEDSLRGQATGYATLHLRGLDIKNIEPGVMGLGRSDPFFEISRKNADHAAGVVRWNSIYRSKHIHNHLNPYWGEFTLSLEEICFGDLDWPIKIIVYDYQANGKHRPIGQFETSLNTMRERVAVRGNADREMAFEIFSEGDNKTRGLIVVLKCDIRLEG